ncbi:MAG TPA: hypothetical protein VIH59_25520 [Candidatus Tectomicrobia bacterium]|jgi:hypothetical protein
MRKFRTMFVVSLCLACMPPGFLAYAQAPPRLTFAELVDAIKAELELTQKIKSYSGQEVEIQGFIIPAGPPDLSFFLLSRVSALGNYCCEVPVGQDETVYVFTAQGANILYDPLRVYKVRGIFEAGMQTDKAYGVSLFRLRQAHVEEAVGARIFKVGETTAPGSKP